MYEVEYPDGNKAWLVVNSIAEKNALVYGEGNRHVKFEDIIHSPKWRIRVQEAICFHHNKKWKQAPALYKNGW